MNPFVLVATKFNTLIVNQFCFGVGKLVINEGYYEPFEVEFTKELLTKRREYYGDAVTVMDCGANLGTFTVEWARHMNGWGMVVAVEAQERTFYALCGNIALNNCLNARAILGAVTDKPGIMEIPQLDFRKPSHFSGFELRKRAEAGSIGQVVDYENNLMAITALSIDSINFTRLDFLKIDIEGMDLEALHGGEATIVKHRPIIYIEVLRNKDEIRSWLQDRGYKIAERGINFLATHKEDISYDV